AGFILADKAPYPLSLILKRIFNFSFFGIFPWFAMMYTGYRKKAIPIIITVLAILIYIQMVLSTNENQTQFRVKLILASILLMVTHGYLAGKHLFKYGNKKRAKWFLTALSVFFLLFISATIYQSAYTFFSRLLHFTVFFPLNLFPLSFIIIMGIRMRADSIEKFQLARLLGLKNKQWQSLLNNMNLIIVLTDKNGRLKYINPFGTKLMEYESSSEMLDKNWFDYFMPGPGTTVIRDLFRNAGNSATNSSYFKNMVITKTGIEKTISWHNEPIHDEGGELTGVMSFGIDISDQELAFEKISDLKAELEKENLMLKGEPIPEWMQQEIIGKSEAIVYAIQKAGKVAPSQASVLLEGETGVGKELFADLIQRNSSRSSQPFVKVNCGALPSELIEDELFGHEKGAFTGAGQSRKGRFEIAHGGTIFLDEIGELPLHLQPKLLRVLQNGEFERIGGQQTIKIDVRVIAATNRDLKLEVDEGRFRDDLYYRLNVYPITIPPLKARKEDIPMLIQYYIDRKARKHGKTFRSISKADLNSLSDYNWPGNIRELKNVIERSVISSENNGVLKLDWFYAGLKDKKNGTLPKSLEQLEKEHIIKVLEDCHWRVSGERGAAEKLTMNPNTLRSKMRKLKISRDAEY
ncbi:MAG TPA: sigma 54-interacting transcriptional regulator, partial [Puia sp.]|nr:sigma 54-interacting transcriptional regulator [Puia sp.]